MNWGLIILIYIITLIIVYLIDFYAIRLSSAVSFMIASIIGIIILFILAQFLDSNKMSLISFGILAFIATFIMLVSIAVAVAYSMNKK